MMPSAAFTVTSEEPRELANYLPSPCEVRLAGSTDEDFVQFNALWDTGATHSAITQEVVNQCGLKPTGTAQVHHAGNDESPEETDAYTVDVRLPNQVLVRGVRVSRGGFKGGDVLIGMDIINTGDFAITHPEGRTRFTFQIPSQAEIDFVADSLAPGPQTRAERRRAEKRSRKR